VKRLYMLEPRARWLVLSEAEGHLPPGFLARLAIERHCG